MEKTPVVLSRRVRAIKPSATLSLTAKAKAMKAEGIDVIGFGAGEPDFDTPSHITEAAKRALDEGFTNYTPTSGIPELKRAICEKLQRDNGLKYESSQVVVGCGAKHCIFNALQALCDDDDEVILPAPYWPSYAEQITAAGGKTVVIEAREDDGFKISPQFLSEHITPKTKIFIIISPSNPTGAVYSRDELKGMADVLAKRGIWVISDEVYEKIVYGVEHVSIASMSPEMKDKTIVINGVSKPYSMTGWRIGYAAGDKAVIGAMSNLQDHSTSNPTSFAQKGAVAALTGPQEVVGHMVSEFRKRRDFLVDGLNQIPGISCILPQGAFYVFPNVSGLLSKSVKGQPIQSSHRLAEVLLEDAKVAVVPGGPFGSDDHMRLSYATSMEEITEGLQRIEEWVKNLP